MFKQYYLGNGPLHDAGVFAADRYDSAVAVKKYDVGCVIAVTAVGVM